MFENNDFSKNECPEPEQRKPEDILFDSLDRLWGITGSDPKFSLKAIEDPFQLIPFNPTLPDFSDIRIEMPDISFKRIDYPSEVKPITSPSIIDRDYDSPSFMESLIPPSFRSLSELRDNFRSPEQVKEELMGLLSELEGRRDGYEIFPRKSERKEIVEICNKVVDYLHDNEIPNLVLLDRSARPAYIGIMKLWHKKYPDKQMPNIYFVNPTGFIDREAAFEKSVSGFPRMVELKLASDKSQDNIGDMKDFIERTEEVVQADFEGTYSRLIADKDKPLLVFDNCIHHGRAFKPVRNILEKAGFSLVKFGVSSEDRNHTDITPDLVCLDRVPLGLCYPFHHDTLVDKQIKSVKSSPANELDRKNEAYRTRKELYRIFDEAPEEWYR